MALHGTKALEKWARDIVGGYKNVNILNMTTSWRNGLGFCAIIHHFHPDLIDFDSLDPDDVFGNNDIAFQVAEHHLGIPSLLDPQDMVECELLDRLSILTYLSQYYQAFQSSNVQVRQKLLGSISKSSSANSDLSTDCGLKFRRVPTIGRQNEPCRQCNKPVFILERLNVTGRILHRTCFKCARCSTQLSLVSYYETETGSYCCDICPDEEKDQTATLKANRDFAELMAGHDDSNADQDFEALMANNDSQDDSGNSSEGEDGQGGSMLTPKGSLRPNQSPSPSVKSVEDCKVVEDLSVVSAYGVPVSIDEVDVSVENVDSDVKTVDHDDNDESDSAITDQNATVSENEMLKTEDIVTNGDSIILEKKEVVDTDAICDMKVNDDLVVSDEAIDSTTDQLNNCNLENKLEPVEENELELKTVESVDLESGKSNGEDLESGKSNGEKLQQSQENVSKPIEKENVMEVEKIESTNPFGSDFEDDEDTQIPLVSKSTEVPSKHEESTNPFGSDFENDEDEAQTNLSTVAVQQGPPKPPRLSLNPFGSDFEDDDATSVRSVSPSPSVRTMRKKRPAPKPPGSGTPASTTPVASPRSKSLLATSRPTTIEAGAHRSTTLEHGAQRPSTLETGAHRPTTLEPPVPAVRHSKTPQRSVSPCNSTCSGGARRSKKEKPAPPPPIDPTKRQKNVDNEHRRSQLMESVTSLDARSETTSLRSVSTTRSSDYDVSTTRSSDYDVSTTRSSDLATSDVASSSGVSVFSPLSPDKAEEGLWKKKKGPAPPRPIPLKRTVKKLPRKAINQELQDIEVRQGEFERQGVKLEMKIRELCNKSDAEEGADRDSLGPEAEDLIIQLFDLVNEKNDLFRRQTELIYMKKENRLEEQHADLEYQVRIIMSKPESQRTEEDRVREEKLIAKLVEVVGHRNEIVDCLEMERLREIDEDNAIEDHMSNYAAVKTEEPKKHGIEKILKRKKKKKKNEKSKSKAIDADKDIDTSEVKEAPEESSPSKTKKKSTRKKLLNLATKKLTFPSK